MIFRILKHYCFQVSQSDSRKSFRCAPELSLIPNHPVLRNFLVRIAPLLLCVLGNLSLAQFEGPQAQSGGEVMRPGDVPDQFFSGFQFGKGAQSVYSGGGNFDQLQGSSFGPYNLGDRAEYGTLYFALNQEFFYDSNVFLDNSDAIAGEGSVTSPGFQYKLGVGEDNAFRIGLDVNLIEFFNTPAVSSRGQYYLPYLDFTFRTGIVSWTIADNPTIVQGGGRTSNNNQLTLRSPRIDNTFSISNDIEMNDKLSTGFFYNQFNYFPAMGEGLVSYEDMNGGFEISHQTFAKVRTLVRGTGGYLSGNDGYGQQHYGRGEIGARGDFNEFLTGTFRGGAEWRGFSPGRTSSGLGDNMVNNPAQIQFIGFASLLYQPYNDFQVELILSRSFLPSVVTGPTDGQTFLATVGGFSADYQFGDLVKNEQDPNEPGFNPKAQKMREFSIGLDFNYIWSYYSLQQSNNNPNSPMLVHQSSSLYTPALSFEWHPQPYMMVYAIGSYQRNQVNVYESNYNDFRASLGATWQF